MTKNQREIIAKELWNQFTKSKYPWGDLISTRKIAWYKRADNFIERTNGKLQ